MPAMSSRDKYADELPPQFAIIPIYEGKPPASALAYGSFAALTGADHRQLKADSAALRDIADQILEHVKAQNQQDEAQTSREEDLLTLARNIGEGMNKLSARMDALEAQLRVQSRFDAEPITLPPGANDDASGTNGSPDGPNGPSTRSATPSPGTSSPANDADEPDKPLVYDNRSRKLINAEDDTTSPPGDLPEPPLELEDDDNLGDLPAELDLEVEAPADPGPEPRPRGTNYPQPTAISLNSATARQSQ